MYRMPVLRLFAEDFVIFWRHMDSLHTEVIERQYLTGNQRAHLAAYKAGR